MSYYLRAGGGNCGNAVRDDFGCIECGEQHELHQRYYRRLVALTELDFTRPVACSQSQKRKSKYVCCMDKNIETSREHGEVG